MSSSGNRVENGRGGGLGFFGRTASALRARLERLRGLGGSLPADHEGAPVRPAGYMPAARTIAAPEGLCLYAVGDIHGRHDLLVRLVGIIAEDAAKLPAGIKPQLIFLGDYIDRGLQSRDVINFFTCGGLDQFDPVYLMGNHEEALLRFLQQASFGSQWARFGGSETLYSYGLKPPNQRASLNSHEEMSAAREAWTRIWNAFRTRLPEEHRAFFQSLKPYHLAGDYLFVHAGLRPGLNLDQQTTRDMLWIREEFLDDQAEFAHKIVHGHTPMETVHHDYRRIGLDTGAFLTGRLTAAKLIGTDVAFLST